MTGDRLLAFRDIADYLGVKVRTVYAWHQGQRSTRVPFPDPDGPPIGGRPTWREPTICEWARVSGRQHLLGANGRTGDHP